MQRCRTAKMAFKKDNATFEQEVIMTIGERIKQARKKAGLTQKELAEKTGLATGTIQQYEYNQYKPKFENAQRIADALGVSLNALVGMRENTQSEDDIHQLAIEKYGIDHEKDILMEEMAELQKEIIKERRGFGRREDVIDELADVYICLGHLIYYYGDITEAVKRKKERLRRKIELNDENY